MNSISIQSPARLHFGLIEIGVAQPQRFGGVGVTISEPAARLKLTASDRWHAIDKSPDGATSDRTLAVDKVANLWCQARGYASLPPLQIAIESAAPRHFGLGSGTQLATCVVTLLEHWHQFGWRIDSSKSPSVVWQTTDQDDDENKLKESGEPRPEELLAKFSGRGKRSFIGLTGFLRGGWIIDHGINRVSDDSRTESYLPNFSPKIILILPDDEPTVAGQTELSIFDQLKQQPNSEKAQMNSLLFENIAPFLKKIASQDQPPSTQQTNDFDESVYEYGRLAGLVFEPSQGGEYATPIIGQRVSALRQSGIRGVGQSSWGPGIFCFCWNTEQLAAVRYLCSHNERFQNCRFTETTVATQGATLSSSNDTT